MESNPPRSHRSVTDHETRLALLASIVDSTDDAIISKDLEGIVTSWNRAAEEIYGYDAEEIMGTSFARLVHPEHTEEVATILERIRQGQRIEHHETLWLKKSGTSISVSLTVSPIHDPDGNVIGASTIARDVTEQRRVEELARTASQFARRLLEATLDPLVTISADGKITDANEATVKVTGVSREKLIGTDFCDSFTEPDNARAGFREAFSTGSVTDYPLTIRHRDGHHTYVLYNATVYQDAAGRPLGVFAAARNVTAQKTAEAELATQRTVEMERLAELERFQKLTVGRELKMIELKKEIELLKRAAR